MLEFKSLQLQDKEWVQPILAASGSIGNEGVFGTLYIWGEVYHHGACLYNGTLYSRYGGESNIYGAPRGGDLASALNVMRDDAHAGGHRFRLWGLTREQVEEVERTMPGTFDFRLDRDGSDYVYKTSDLIALAGRKFHDKRNHLNRFRRTYRYAYEDITSENIKEVASMASQWRSANHSKGDEELKMEGCALDRALADFAELGFIGGLIRIEGAVAAFTIGEEINGEVFLIHFEKAAAGYNGLYAAINHEFAARRLEKYLYVNREEDLGLEGLRKAKLSYNPAFILEKYNVRLRGERASD